MTLTDILLAIIGGGGVGGLLRFVTKISSSLAVLTRGVAALERLLDDHETRVRALEQRPVHVDLAPPS